MGEDTFQRNAILAQLPDDEYARLRPHLQLEHPDIKQSVYEPGAAIKRVYFPLSAVYSIVAGVTDSQLIVEVATIGHEGFVGLPLYLGSATSPHTSHCQIPGDAAGLDADMFREALGHGGALHALVGRYTQATMVQVSQNVVCNRSHSAEKRMARWLLTTHDRIGRDQFLLTQQFLAQMLGVHRPTVSDTAQRLQSENLIRYSRGDLTIVDRHRLEKLTCDCYYTIKAEFDIITNYQPTNP